MPAVVVTKLYCEVYTQRILPALRALIAKILVQEHKLSQVDAAKLLEVTQASINYYISGKRGKQVLEALEKIAEVREKARTIAKELIENGADASVLLCDWCNSLRKNIELLEDIARILGVREIRVSKDHILIINKN